MFLSYNKIESLEFWIKYGLIFNLLPNFSFKYNKIIKPPIYISIFKNASIIYVLFAYMAFSKIINVTIFKEFKEISKSSAALGIIFECNDVALISYYFMHSFWSLCIKTKQWEELFQNLIYLENQININKKVKFQKMMLIPYATNIFNMTVSHAMWIFLLHEFYSVNTIFKIIRISLIWFISIFVLITVFIIY